MLLYNHTGIDDKVLRPFLTAAAHSAGLKPVGRVAVKVIWGKACSRAHHWWQVNHKWITRRPRARISGKPTRWLSCEGCIELNLRNKAEREYRDWARTAYYHSAENIAERFYKVAVHEFKHIADFRDRLSFREFNRNHGNRPHEIRANCQEREAIDALAKDTRRQELILNVGIEIERISAEKQ